LAQVPIKQINIKDILKNLPIPGESEYFRIGIFLTDGTEEATGAAEDAEGGLDGAVCAEGAGGGLDGDV